MYDIRRRGYQQTAPYIETPGVKIERGRGVIVSSDSSLPLAFCYSLSGKVFLKVVIVFIRTSASDPSFQHHF